MILPFFLFSIAYLILPFKKDIKEFLGDFTLFINAIRIYSIKPNLIPKNPQLYIQYERDSLFDNHIMLEISWYAALIPHTKDYMMLLHHILSTILLLIGYEANMTYITFLQLSLTITSNVFLHIAKITHKRNYKYKEIAFLFFAFVFFITRILIFPLYIAPILTFEIRDYLIKNNIYYILNIGMYILIFMQFYWFRKIINIIYK